MSGSSFHTLTSVNTRTYPIVPAPIQARDIPTINQQYIDERHIQLYQPITTFQHHQTMPTVTVIKNEQVDFDLTPLKNGGTLHASNFQNPLIDNGLYSHNHHQNDHNLVTPSIQDHHISHNDSKMDTTPSQITRVDNRKKERRKMRASSLESSADSDGSAMEIDSNNSGQVAAISSTANFKSPMHMSGLDDTMETGEKQVKS